MRQLVLLTIAVLYSSISSYGMADGGAHRRPTLVPSCLKMLQKLSETQISSLRDAAQVRSTTSHLRPMHHAMHVHCASYRTAHVNALLLLGARTKPCPSSHCSCLHSIRGRPLTGSASGFTKRTLQRTSASSERVGVVGGMANYYRNCGLRLALRDGRVS